MAFDQRPASSEIVQIALAKARELDNWIDGALRGIELKGDHRHRIPAQLFDLAIEHHAGVIELLSSRLYASGFALVRCVFECFLRGAWLQNCATDAELQTFLDRDRIVGVPKMIEALEQTDEFKGGFLSKWKEDGWRAMNGYTHGGVHQISRRMQGEYIEPDFEDDAILEVIRFTGAMALLAVGQVAGMAGGDAIWEEATAKMKGL